MIKGETVKLVQTTQTGTDPFGNPTYSETEIEVENVIIGTPSTNEIVNDLQLYGKALLFVLGIPKGDTHDWQDKTVIIRGSRFSTYGFPLVQTAANVPGNWNAQVKVAKYGG